MRRAVVLLLLVAACGGCQSFVGIEDAQQHLPRLDGAYLVAISRARPSDPGTIDTIRMQGTGTLDVDNRSLSLAMSILPFGGGTPLMFGIDDWNRPFWITPKVQVVRAEKTQAAVGLLHVFDTDGDSGGIAYGVGTFGDADNAATIGAGMAYADDHRGHGLTAGTAERAGIVGPDGWNRLVDDAKEVTDHLRKVHPGLPVVLLGHSMGSFIAQDYIRRHGEGLIGAVLTGTAGLTDITSVRKNRLVIGWNAVAGLNGTDLNRYGP